MRKVIPILCLLALAGCSLETRPDPATQVEVFQDLLRQGWYMQVVDGKVVLVKETKDGLLVNDVFGTGNNF